jgi:AmmeMemoRadiSam system protein B
MLALFAMPTLTRPPLAGSWYPRSATALAAQIDDYLAAGEPAEPPLSRVMALVSPHAGLIYSGPVAGFAYRQLTAHPPGLVILVGPSHFVDFEGVAVIPAGALDTPIGTATIDEVSAAALIAATPIIRERPSAHAREHSLEMQLPFLCRVAPGARIVPLVMGRQTAATAAALADALASVLASRDALLVASTDLSHYHDAATAHALDHIVLEHVARFDAEGLQDTLNERHDHACGGGPLVAVMKAARRLGARQARVLRYADSGDVSGDKSSVVGYMAAVIGMNDDADAT